MKNIVYMTQAQIREKFGLTEEFDVCVVSDPPKRPADSPLAEKWFNTPYNDKMDLIVKINPHKDTKFCANTHVEHINFLVNCCGNNEETVAGINRYLESVKVNPASFWELVESA